MRTKNLALLWPLITTLILGNGLLLLPAGSFFRLVGALLLLLLPGLAWSLGFIIGPTPLERGSLGLGLSYALAIIVGLLLHYIPGPLPAWLVIVSFNLLTLLGLLLAHRFPHPSTPPTDSPPQSDPLESSPPHRFILIGLLLIMLVGGIFRGSSLGYSEFQGDEVKALVPAAEAIEGRSEALFDQRKKGPGEIVMPMLVWSMTGLIDETAARLPFALAGMMTIITVYVLGRALFDARIGLIAAALVALNGFMVAFSRIVQYQQLVVWLSLLAVLCAWHWRQDGRARWGVLSGIFLAAGVLAHFDAFLAALAVAFLLVSNRAFLLSAWKAVLPGLLSFAAVLALFFLPYLLTPQRSSTGSYLEQRIGLSLVKNSLPDFYHYAIFYNSFYYVLIVGLLALAFLLMALIKLPLPRPARLGLAGLAGGAVVVLALFPQALTLGGIDWAALPFALLFLGAFLSPALALAERLVVIWFGLGFLTYNFLIADPRTHFYSLVPAWTLLAALTLGRIEQRALQRFKSPVPMMAASIIMALLFSGYLYVVYLRHEPEFEIDWPASRPWLYRSPYQRLQLDDSFGMVHRAGWKALGGLYLDEKLAGDYQTNGLYETGDWYTRHQLRGCYRRSTYFLAMSYLVFDPRDLPNYNEIAAIDLTDGKGIHI
ncbi:MAG: glycosyltransferase family 39 protein, partial [Anaerolineae bacterium]|nr:glycosyltransferase family 39 protein [Anaerolineae bacterium]